MKKYKLRIIRDRKGYWRVERKRFLLFWFCVKCFASESEAQCFIDDCCSNIVLKRKPITVYCDCETRTKYNVHKRIKEDTRGYWPWP